MNIFQCLGLKKEHRSEKKVTQLVKNYGEVASKHKKNLQFDAQVKKDGVCSLTVIRGGRVNIFSRTGKMFANTEVLVDKLISGKLEDGIYLGEITNPNVSLEVLSGVVNPNRVHRLGKELNKVQEGLELHLFDFLTIEEFVEGISNKSYRVRYRKLEDIIKQSTVYNTDFVINIIDSYLMDSYKDMKFFFDRVVRRGEEGIVIRNLSAGWVAGHKGYRAMKKVRGVDYDLLCVGYEEGEGKYKGKIANLLFQWKDGVTIKCMLGKGWTHGMAEYMLTSINNGIGTPVGKIFKVYALQESSKGKLRLAKVGEIRHDKNESDIGKESL